MKLGIRRHSKQLLVFMTLMPVVRGGTSPVSDSWPRGSFHFALGQLRCTVYFCWSLDWAKRLRNGADKLLDRLSSQNVNSGTNADCLMVARHEASRTRRGSCSKASVPHVLFYRPAPKNIHLSWLVRGRPGPCTNKNTCFCCWLLAFGRVAFGISVFCSTYRCIRLRR